MGSVLVDTAAELKPELLCLGCKEPLPPRPRGTRGRRRTLHPGCAKVRKELLVESYETDAKPKPKPVTIAIASAAPATTRPPQFKVQCKAIDGNTGSRCKLLSPHDGHPHATERGQFHQVLVEGATPYLVEQLTAAAGTQRENSLGIASGSASATAYKKSWRCRACSRAMRSANDEHNGRCIHCLDAQPLKEAAP